MMPILLCVAVVVVALTVERRRRRELAAIARSWTSIASLRDRSDGVRGLAERARRYLGAASSIMIAVRPGEHVLELRDIAASEPTRIRERERDVRRGVFATTTPIWHDTFMDDGTHTLVVPLVSRGNKVGFWMVSFVERDLTAVQRELIANLARELTCALAATPDEPSALDTIRRGQQDHHDLARLCEAMPYGVFVMSVWGHVRYANTAMKLSCAMHGIDLDEHDPVALLGALTEHDDVLAELRAAVQSQAPLCLRGARGSVALSWLVGDDASERLLVGWVLPDAGVESQALLSSLSMTTINAETVGPSGTLRLFAVNQ